MTGLVAQIVSVEGELHASIVWISDGAQVEGAIVAQELIIGGRFKGTIQANRVTLIRRAICRFGMATVPFIWPPPCMLTRNSNGVRFSGDVNS